MRRASGVAARCMAALLLAVGLVCVGAGAASATVIASAGWSFSTSPTSSHSGTYVVYTTVTTPTDPALQPITIKSGTCSFSGSYATRSGTSGNWSFSGTYNLDPCGGSTFLLTDMRFNLVNNATGATIGQVIQWLPDATNGASCSGTGAGTVLTDAQLVAVAYGAGFRDASPQYQSHGLTWATAVALAESGAQVDAVNTANADGSTDRGLWQINSIHTQYDAAKLLSDAAYNAAAAFQISGSGTNWMPWNSFWAGSKPAYAMYARAAAAVAGTPFTGTIPCGGSNAGLPPAEPSGTPIPGSSTSGVGGETGFDSCVPKGWDFLNPLAYVKGTACVLRVAFVPQSGSGTAWTAFRTAVSARPPFSLVTTAYTFINGIITGIRTGNQAQVAGTSIPASTVAVPGGSFSMPGYSPLTGINHTDCSGGNPLGASTTSDTADCQTGLPASMVLFRNVIRVMLWGGFLFLVWRRMSAAIGAKPEGDEA
jgi:hypothetical protein